MEDIQYDSWDSASEDEDGQDLSLEEIPSLLQL